MNITPLRDGVLVEVKGEEEKIGSIFVPDAVKFSSEKKQSGFGTVVAVGADVTEVKVGDKIVFNEYGDMCKNAFPQRTIGEGRILMKEEDIVAFDLR